MPNLHNKNIPHKQLHSLLKRLQETMHDSPADALLMLIAQTGCRSDEACKITRQHFAMGPNGICFINIPSSKGGLDRTVPIGKDLHTAIMELLRARARLFYYWESSIDGQGRKQITKVNLDPDNTPIAFLITQTPTKSAWTRGLRRRMSYLTDGKFSPHCLRHTWCFEAAKVTGGNVVLMAKMIGHKNPMSTMNYLDAIKINESLTAMLKLYEVS